LPGPLSDPLAAVAARYAVAITPAMEALIPDGLADPDGDPIARQFRPHVDELAIHPSELADPTADAAHSPVKGVVHRYADRVLLKPVHVCPVYCRFCFRREIVGPEGDGALTPTELAQALDYIRARPQIWEVILTGGDPFVLSPRRVQELTADLAAIAHVKVLRWHTRVPVVDPGRVTADLVAALRAPHKAVWVALHCNHPRELTPAADAAIARLIDAGLPLVSQSVLLAGVNDDGETLEALMRGFVARRIKPYYLHQLDPAPGTRRFFVDEARGAALMAGLRGRASGLCQPCYVRDLPGKPAKTVLG